MIKQSSDEPQADLVAEPVMPIIREHVRAVYPVGKDAWEQGIGESFFFLKNLLDCYQRAKIPIEEIHVHAIFHSQAAYMLLKDDAYEKYTGKDDPNPNAQVVHDLVDIGIDIEICAMTMSKYDFKKEDLLAEVTIVQSTFTRVIDLQMQGYAFISF